MDEIIFKDANGKLKMKLEGDDLKIKETKKEKTKEEKEKKEEKNESDKN